MHAGHIPVSTLYLFICSSCFSLLCSTAMHLFSQKLVVSQTPPRPRVAAQLARGRHLSMFSAAGTVARQWRSSTSAQSPTKVHNQRQLLHAQLLCTACHAQPGCKCAKHMPGQCTSMCVMATPVYNRPDTGTCRGLTQHLPMHVGAAATLRKAQSMHSFSLHTHTTIQCSLLPSGFHRSQRCSVFRA